MYVLICPCDMVATPTGIKFNFGNPLYPLVSVSLTDLDLLFVRLDWQYRVLARSLFSIFSFLDVSF